MINSINIVATDIPDAWFQSLYHIMDHGRKYTIEHGSMVGEERLELDFVTLTIKTPYKEPWDAMLPDIPPHLGIPNPVERGYVEQYLPYLMTNHKEPGEDYTYGERIHDQLTFWIAKLNHVRSTNQAILQVGRPEDYHLTDPPCLRHIDVKIQDDLLIFYPYFRSWDLWGGLPANLAGIAVLQKYMADNIEGVSQGPMLASSKGLHIYGYAEELAKIRTCRN